MKVLNCWAYFDLILVLIVPKQFLHSSRAVVVSRHFTLRAESFAGRKFREDGKSRNFVNLTFANNNFRINFTDKTFANPPKTLLSGEKNFRE